jgi:hypothetical protein
VPDEPTSDDASEDSSDSSRGDSRGESRAEILLREALGIVAPLARALISHGVTYPVFAQALKDVFLQAARAELERDQRRTTDSALSLLSGVHRKDVRALAGDRGPGGERDKRAAQAADAAAARPANLSMAAQVFTRWVRDPAFSDGAGRPRPLPTRAAEGTSFEMLAQSVSKDFHARSVLDELVRLHLVEVKGGTVRPLAGQFTPAAGFAELAYFFGANVRDHLAAGAANLHAVQNQQPPPFLEHAMFADGLTEQSTHELQEAARQAWTRVMSDLFAAARRQVAADAGLGAEAQQRVRFGAYFYAEPGVPTGGQASSETPSQAPVEAPGKAPTDEADSSEAGS